MTFVLTLLGTFAALVMIILLVVLVFASFWRRRDALPPDMFDGDLPDAGVQKGFYLATFEDGWNKAMSADGFLSGGEGIFYIDEKGVNFLIDGSRQPVHLPFARITGASAESVPAGEYKGKTALVVNWKLQEKDLRSAFVLEGADAAGIARQILAGIPKGE